MPAAPPVPRRFLVLGIDYEDSEEEEQEEAEEEEEQNRPISMRWGRRLIGQSEFRDQLLPDQ